MYEDFFNDADERSDPNEDISEDDQAISYANQGSVKDKTKGGDNDFVENDNSEVETELSGQTDNNTIKSTFQKQQAKVIFKKVLFVVLLQIIFKAYCV